MVREVGESVRDLIYRGIVKLDANDFTGWLELCAPHFHYTISAWSPEIRREVIWLDHDREGMANLVKLLPRHNSDQTPLTRHATVYTVDIDPGQDSVARAITSVAIYATQLDGGATDLWALGRYHDVIALGPHGARLAKRVVKLETRNLGIGKHWPL
jgi:methanesulfonate monooxygenase small subunit